MCLPSSSISRPAAWRLEKNLRYHISVDGGIDFQTAPDCARVGANAFISGTALFHAHSLRAAVSKLRRLVSASDPALADLAV